MSQKTDTMIKLAMVFFISLLSLSIGTFVGKKYSDNQHKLASLEPKKSNSEESSKTAAHDEFASSEGSTASNNHKMSDEEVAKLAEEFAQDDHNQRTIAETDSEEKDIKEIPNTKEERKPSSVPVVAKTTTTTTTTKETTTKPATAEVSNTSGMYTLQVGSFPTEAEAGKLATNLTAKGFKASFIPASVNGKTWYRVNVGLFGTVKEAQDYKPEFLEKSKLTSALVQKAPATK